MSGQWSNLSQIFTRGSKHTKAEETAASAAQTKEKQDKEVPEGDETCWCFIDITFVFFATFEIDMFDSLSRPCSKALLRRGAVFNIVFVSSNERPAKGSVHHSFM